MDNKVGAFCWQLERVYDPNRLVLEDRDEKAKYSDEREDDEPEPGNGPRPAEPDVGKAVRQITRSKPTLRRRFICTSFPSFGNQTSQ